MVDSESSLDREISEIPDGVVLFGAVGRPPSSGAALGSWGLAHLTGARSIDGRPRLVGRELESIRLLHLLDAVVHDRAPAVATISAPTGMGKSRLIQETLVLARMSGFEGRIFSVAALPGDTSNALISRLLRARFGLDVAAGVYAQQAALLKQFSADASRAPLCLVVEDMQHADADSLAGLMALLDELGGAALTLCSARPEFFAEHEYFSQLPAARHEHLELTAFDRSDVRSLLRQMLGPEVADDPVLEQYMVEEGLGNPGLMQQLTSELWVRGALESDRPDGPPTLRPERLRSSAAEYL